MHHAGLCGRCAPGLLLARRLLAPAAATPHAGNASLPSLRAWPQLALPAVLHLPCRPLVACAAGIKPGSKPEDVVKRITKDDVQVSFARSGGAGGQNVNKVNTKVDMRLSLEASWLREELVDALQRTEKKRINKEGELVITSQRTRSQADNVEDALAKLQSSLDRAAESIIPAKPDPEKAKEIAKRKKVANENRIQNKKAKSEKKSMRRGKIEW